MVAKAEPAQTELEQIAIKYAPKVRDAILNAIKIFLTTTTEEVVLREFKRNGLQGLLELADNFGNDFAAQVTPLLYNAWLEGGRATIALLPPESIVTPIVFETLPILSVSSAEQHRAQLVQQVTYETKTAITQAVERGIIAGVNPRDTARDFRAAIGLTSRQETAVYNYRNLLMSLDIEALDRELRDKRFDRLVSRHIFEDKALSAEQIDRIVERYRQRYIRYRSEVISRTESLRAVHMGEFESMFGAYQDGKLDPNLKKYWVVRDDSRLRPAHRLIPAMNPMGRYIYESFSTPLGLLRYPLDPQGIPSNVIQCRCTLVYGMKKPLFYRMPQTGVAPRDGLSLPNSTGMEYL